MKTFFWVDLEMTGLDDKKDQILEVAIIVTDLDFKPLDEYHKIVYQPAEALVNMNDWVRKTHTDSGLVAAVAHGTPLAQVEQDILALIDRHYKPDDRVVLAGNSVGNDKRFIDSYMPQVAKRLHYRIIDVSSFKEVFRSKYNLIFEKRNTHRALEDIDESIRELTFYLSYLNL